MKDFRDWVSLDWDTWNLRFDVDAELLNASKFLNARYGKGTFAITVRKSPRGGYHVLIKTRFPMVIAERFEIRRALKDDRARLSWDRLRANGDSLTDYSRGVLFDAKMIPYRGETLYTPGEWKVYHA